MSCVSWLVLFLGAWPSTPAFVHALEHERTSTTGQHSFETGQRSEPLLQRDCDDGSLGASVLHGNDLASLLNDGGIREEEGCSFQTKTIFCEHLLQTKRVIGNGKGRVASSEIQAIAGQTMTSMKNSPYLRHSGTSSPSSNVTDPSHCDGSVPLSEESSEREKTGSPSDTKAPMTEPEVYPSASILRRGAKITVPRAQRWTHCEFCALEGRPWVPYSGPDHADRSSRNRAEFNTPENVRYRHLHGVLFDPTGELMAQENMSERIVISEHKWAGYFVSSHTNYRSTVYAQFTKESFGLNACARIVETPTFFFHMVCPQVGHLIIDVMEPLFYTMLNMAGGDLSKWDTNVILVIDVSTKEEQESLRRHFQQAYRYDSSPFQMLRAFTRHPIHTAESLARLPGRTCFHSLHTGLDISKTYYVLGYDRHPLPLARGERDEDERLFMSYRTFQAFLTDRVLQSNEQTTSPTLDLDGRRRQSILDAVAGSSDEEAPPPPLRIAFIRRSGRRRLTNFETLVDVATKAAAKAVDPSPPSVNDKGKDGHQTNDSHTGRRSHPTEGPRNPNRHTFSGWEVTELRLELLSFAQQVDALRATDVLVAQYGTGLHNSFLMRPTSVIVTLMTPEWCESTWQMADQAIASGLHVVAYCQEPSPGRHPWAPVSSERSRRWARMRWSEKGWLQNTWRSKDAAATIGTEAFGSLLDRAIDLVGSRSTPQLHHVELEIYDGGRLSATVDQDSPVEVFAHIGDIALELSGETGGSQELPAFSEGQWMLTVIPEVYTNAPDLRSFFVEQPLEWCYEVTARENCAGHCPWVGRSESRYRKSHEDGGDRGFLYSVGPISTGIDNTILFVRAWLRDIQTGADIPDSESLVLVPLSDAKIQPSAKFARAPADSDGVRLDSTSAAGVLSLFPDGGRVFPIGKKRRFRLDLVSGRENDTDGMVGDLNPRLITRGTSSVHQTTESVWLDLDGQGEEELQRAVPRLCRNRPEMDCAMVAENSWRFAANTAAVINAPARNRLDSSIGDVARPAPPPQT